MKFLKIAGTAAVLLLFGTISPVSAQREEKQGKPEEQHTQQQHSQQPQPRAKQPQRQEPQQRAQQPQQRAQQPQQHAQQPQQRAQQPQRQEPQQRAQQPQQHAQQPQQRAQQPQRQQPQQHVQPQRAPQQAQAWQQQRGWLKPGGWQGHASFRQDGSNNWASDHRSWAQRGGYGGSYITQDSYNLYFGGQHFFRIGLLPVMYMGYPRFAYGGYSFLLVDPYPGNWSPNWYSSDDCYIDYENGYYLHDRRYPGINLAITVAL
jgi:hypothetical protein